MARAMEQILNDHADRYQASKRGGGNKRRVALDDDQARDLSESDAPSPIDPELMVTQERAEHHLAVREAIRVLDNTSPRQAEVIRLLSYGGLTREEVAASLEVSVETVKLDSKKARAFMRKYLEG